MPLLHSRADHDHAAQEGQGAAATPSPEAALVAAVRRGQRAALETLITLHQKGVYGYLRARLTEPADAEDLTQEVFLRCYTGRVRFPEAVALRPWLLGIARNLLREHVRRARMRKEVAWTELCLELDTLVADEEQPTYDALPHLPGCIAGLGQSARQALEMQYDRGYRHAQIGDEMGRSEGAVKLLIHRARQALRMCLDKQLKKNDEQS